MKSKRWQDWINLLLGAWLFASPWLMNYSNDLPKAAANARILGAAIMLLAATAISVPNAWEEITNIVLGAWLVVSPWILGFASNRDITTNSIINVSPHPGYTSCHLGHGA